MNAAYNIYDLKDQKIKNLQSDYRKGMPSRAFAPFAFEYLEAFRSYRKDYSSYVNAIKHFESFEIHIGRKFQTNQIGCDLLIQFHSFLQLTEKLKLSTASGIITKIKYLLKRAYDEGWNVNNSFRETRVSAGETFSIALSPKQVARIYYFQGLTKKDEEIKDMFIFLCCSGLRYSDAINVRPEHIHGDIIIKKTQKTKTTVYIPIDGYIKEIFDKYGGQPPKARTAQHFNEYIKRICEQVGLTTNVSYETEVGGDVKMVTTRICDAISSHTGRRTYITNEFRKGNGIEKIQPVVGHKSVACTMRYNKLSKLQNAKILAAIAS